MNDYCYIIVDKLSKSYYIGQSTVAIDAQNSRNRMYAHVLTCLGLNGYRGKMEDFTTFIKNKSELSGIDKIWYNDPSGFKDSLFYIFNRPGVDTLQESCQLLLDCGFFAGANPDNLLNRKNIKNTFGPKYSASMGEVLLIDYYANKGLTLVRGGNTYDLTMLNSKVGGQGSAVSYSPLQSRWGREVLSKCSDEAQKAFYWRKIQGTKLRKSFNSTVNDPNNKVDRLSAFLSNPKSDPALYAVTENCIEAVVIEEVKCIFTKVVKQYIKDNYVRFLVEGVTAKEGGKIHFPEKIKEEVLKKLPNFSTEDVTIDYSVDWENTTLKCIGFRNSVNDIFKGLKKEYKINQLKDVTKTIEKIVDNTIKNLKLGTITMDCKVKIGNFAFKKAPALKSKLKEEIEGKATLVNYNSLKSIMVSAIIDGVCWYIWKSPQIRKGICYRDVDGRVAAPKWNTGATQPYKMFLRATLISEGMPRWITRENCFNVIYRLAMWQYRRYFDKHFVFSGDDYVFSDISATDNYLFLPGDLEMINQKEVMDTSNSKPRNLYFIKGSWSLRRKFERYELDEPDKADLMDLF